MSGRRINILTLLPPVLFLSFALAAYLGLKRESPNELPSAFVGKAAPALENIAPFSSAQLPTNDFLRAPGFKLVNFWASWCGPCRAEHPILLELGQGDIPVIGVNYKDDPENAVGFLEELGDPYDLIGTDGTGRTGLDWGIYGVPETFVIGPDGTILLRHPGPLTPEILEKRIRPLLSSTD